MGYIEPLADQRNLETPPEPALEVQIIPEYLEEIAVKEGIHERIQAEIIKGTRRRKSGRRRCLRFLQNGMKSQT